MLPNVDNILTFFSSKYHLNTAIHYVQNFQITNPSFHYTCWHDTLAIKDLANERLSQVTYYFITSIKSNVLI